MSNPIDLTNIISNLIGDNQKIIQQSSFIKSFLDHDNDDCMVDDLLNRGKKILW